MATLTALAQRVRHNLYSQYPAERPFMAALGAGYTNVATTIVVPDGTNWAKGDILENLTTAEQVLVTSVSTNTLTVSRAINGTTAAAGATGDIVSKNSRLSMAQINEAVNAILQELAGHGLYRLATSSITLVTGTYLYDFAITDLVDPPGLIALYLQEEAYDTAEPLPGRLQADLHPALAASTFGLLLQSTGTGQAGDTVYVVYAADLTDPADLPAKYEELVVLGATGRLIGKLIAPMIHDPGHLTNRSVPPGQASRDARWYQGEYLIGVRREAANLAVRTSAVQSSLGTPQLNRQRRWRS